MCNAKHQNNTIQSKEMFAYFRISFFFAFGRERKMKRASYCYCCYEVSGERSCKIHRMTLPSIMNERTNERARLLVRLSHCRGNFVRIAYCVPFFQHRRIHCNTYC